MVSLTPASVNIALQLSCDHVVANPGCSSYGVGVTIEPNHLPFIDPHH